MPKIRYNASSIKSKFSGGIFNKKIIAVPLGTTITTPFSGTWSGQNVGAHFQMNYMSAPSWASLITGTSASPQTVTVSGVTGTNASAANGTQQMYFISGSYWFKNKNFTGTNYSSLSGWLPNAVLTIPTQ